MLEQAGMRSSEVADSIGNWDESVENLGIDCTVLGKYFDNLNKVAARIAAPNNNSVDEFDCNYTEVESVADNAMDLYISVIDKLAMDCFYNCFDYRLLVPANYIRYSLIKINLLST